MLKSTTLDDHAYCINSSTLYRNDVLPCNSIDARDQIRESATEVVMYRSHKYQNGCSEVVMYRNGHVLKLAKMGV